MPFNSHREADRASPPPQTPTKPGSAPSRLIRFNKPYGVLSQFTAEGRWRGLKDFIAIPDVYVAGRLDADSEGLLLLTNDGKLRRALPTLASSWKKSTGFKWKACRTRQPLRPCGGACSSMTARPGRPGFA